MASGAKKPLHLVVAACKNSGIGVNGQLPWQLRDDMAFFKKITSETTHEGKKNAVIMGRKTWESIPSKFRPLPGRVNVIITNSMQEAPENAHITRSLDEAVELLHTPKFADVLETCFVIGGGSIYKMALDSPLCERVYMTRILHDFECDTFMPDINMDAFKQIRLPHVDHEEKKEGDINFKFEVYHKVPKSTDPLAPFNICAAMLADRTIGKDGTIAWPPIKKDYDHYIKLTGEIKSPGKFVVNIKGRVTWDETQIAEKTRPGLINVVISNTLSVCPLHVSYLAGSLKEALQVLAQPPLRDQIETIWVMGGQQVYEDALLLSECRKIYLTRIHTTYPGDRYFPRFENDFQLIEQNDINSSLQEENGTNFNFEIYERVNKK